MQGLACFRKEAGTAGRVMWEIFRVHQFEKIEQASHIMSLIPPFPQAPRTDCNRRDPSSVSPNLRNPGKYLMSWSPTRKSSTNCRVFPTDSSSRALNQAASQKYELEAWFPFHGAYKTFVSCSNRPDYRESCAPYAIIMLPLRLLAFQRAAGKKCAADSRSEIANCMCTC